ncbi:olfactory receptor 10AG1-like [Trichosurus vulpecula]|uniref:olfactory receptor 10AG1-like n=1 Tax=Trichosurus vulpecula TaxID=9337 RepID=UPI00186AE2AF|nr:olfactory receptor 10AG1-like [Trichosurus vulpecula]
MVGRNLTIVVEFILLGFSDLPKLQEVLFGVFLITYMSILLGNGLIILITKIDPSLQTPMYFFLGNFSFLEICYTSVTLPRMMMNIWTKKRHISFLDCALQLCFLLMLGGTECLLLAVMAYDRYVAICKPLYYSLIMNYKVCIQLVVGSWISAMPVVIGQTYQIFSLPLCGSNKLNHLFCDMPPLLKLVCGNKFMNEFFIYADAVVFAMVPFLLILGSYIKIITTILEMPSATGRYKAFSTCSSHLIVVILFFGSAIITYSIPKSNSLSGMDKVLSLFYTIVTPVFNPMIYSLRNKDVIAALKHLLPKWLVS